MEKCLWQSKVVLCQITFFLLEKIKKNLIYSSVAVYELKKLKMIENIKLIRSIYGISKYTGNVY